MKITLLGLIFLTLSAHARMLAPFSTGEPYFAWENKTITVCWLDNERPEAINFSPEIRKKIENLVPTLRTIPDSEKEQIKALITKEYTKERTGIRFIGWKNCKDMINYDVVLMTGDSSKNREPFKVPLGKANIGRCNNLHQYERLESSEKSYLYLNFMKSNGLKKLTPADLVLLTAIHEFGHLAGLRHEHIRKEAKDDVSCNKGRLGEQMNAKTQAFSVYDPASIMNYCYLDFIGAVSGLKFTVYSNHPASKAEYGIVKPLTLARVSHYKDTTIFKTKIAADSKSISYQVNMGLSKGDVHGLKCMYVYDAKTRKQQCKENFTP